MRWRVGAVLWLPLSGVLGGCQRSVARPASPLAVTFLSVGQGDCAVLQEGEEAILIDAGPKSASKSGTFDAGERIVRRRLRELGVRRLRGIWLTHDDSDHTGGATSLLRAFPGTRAWVGPQSRVPDGPGVLRMPAEGRTTFGAFRIDWRYPAARADQNDNARSALMAIRARGMRFALTGDAPTGVEEGVERLTGGTVDVYRAGHHGSKNSGSSALLRALRPRFVVVSCGAGNRHGHPHPDAVARYIAIGARVLRTDRDGDVAFRSSGSGWELVTTPLDPTLGRASRGR